MDLPKIHERTFIVSKAECYFMLDAIDAAKEFDITWDQDIVTIGQCLINLTRDDKIFLDEYHKKIEQILEDTAAAYNLTYGEMVKILTQKLQDDTKYIIKLERNDSIDKEGDCQ